MGPTPRRRTGRTTSVCRHLLTSSRARSSHTRSKLRRLRRLLLSTWLSTARSRVISRPEKVIHELSEILPDQLFISSHKTSCNSELLESKGITHILSILPQAKIVYPEKFSYKIITDIEDEKDDKNAEKLSKIFTECNMFIHKCLTGGGRILVHCKAGKSRSVSLVIAYLMVLTCYGCEQMVNFVKSKRWCAQPNFKFMGVLREFYGNIEEEIANIGVTEEQAMAARCQIYE